MNEQPTPETDAHILESLHEKEMGDYLARLNRIIPFTRRLERQRNEAREANAVIQAREAELVLSKDHISKRAEGIRCELVEKEKQLEAMCEAIGVAHKLILAVDNGAQQDVDAVNWYDARKSALAKLQPFIKP